MEKSKKLGPEMVADLMDLYYEIRSGKVKMNEAKEANNTAGKIINYYKLECEYRSLPNRSFEIEFLEGHRP